MIRHSEIGKIVLLNKRNPKLSWTSESVPYFHQWQETTLCIIDYISKTIPELLTTPNDVGMFAHYLMSLVLGKQTISFSPTSWSCTNYWDVSFYVDLLLIVLCNNNVNGFLFIGTRSGNSFNKSVIRSLQGFCKKQVFVLIREWSNR